MLDYKSRNGTYFIYKENLTDDCYEHELNNNVYILQFQVLLLPTFQSISFIFHRKLMHTIHSVCIFIYRIDYQFFSFSCFCWMRSEINWAVGRHK